MDDYKNRMKKWLRNFVREELSDDSDIENQSQLSEKAKRDYKAEYKKFQSSTKMKKYRAELNKYNRKKGTYGNGDGKDASHKGGKIVGFEAQSKNRGRAEKSRLKKESLNENLLSFYQYMGDFYGKKGLYPDKKGRDLKVGDINKALAVYLKKYSKDTFTGDSLDRERVRDILIKMKKIDPQYKKQEVQELMEAPSKKVQDRLIKTFIDGALKKAGIKVVKFQPMKAAFVTGRVRWGGFYTVKAAKGTDVLPFYVHQDLSIDLGVSSKDFILGKYSEMNKVVKNLKSFKKSDLMEKIRENKEKMKQYFMKKGDNEKDATDKLRFYDLVKKLYKGAKPAQRAQIMSSLWANESIQEGKMRPAVKKLLKQKGYDPIFHAIDTSKRQFKQMRYSRGEIQDTLFDMFGTEDPKIVKKIKENLNEAVSKSQAQEIMRQLGGRKFEMLMGVKSKGVGKDGLIIHIGRNPKKISHIIIDIDRGKDLYNLTFGKIFKYQFKVVKKLKGIYVDQLHDMIEKYTGLLTTFRKR